MSRRNVAETGNSARLCWRSVDGKVPSSAFRPTPRQSPGSWQLHRKADVCPLFERPDEAGRESDAHFGGTIRKCDWFVRRISPACLRCDRPDDRVQLGQRHRATRRRRLRRESSKSVSSGAPQDTPPCPPVPQSVCEQAENATRQRRIGATARTSAQKVRVANGTPRRGCVKRQPPDVLPTRRSGSPFGRLYQPSSLVARKDSTRSQADSPGFSWVCVTRRNPTQ